MSIQEQLSVVESMSEIKTTVFFFFLIIDKSHMQLLGYEQIILQREVVSFELKLIG